MSARLTESPDTNNLSVEGCGSLIVSIDGSTAVQNILVDIFFIDSLDYNRNDGYTATYAYTPESTDALVSSMCFGFEEDD
jgi:hypothetical protein